MTRKAKPAKPAPPASATAYVVVRELPAETPSFTAPERVFATEKAARAFADARNRELRDLVNPFADGSPEYLVKGGDKAFLALVKKLGLALPPMRKNLTYIAWEEWWDRAYFDMSDEQRGAIWDALSKYQWYKVAATELEG